MNYFIAATSIIKFSLLRTYVLKVIQYPNYQLINNHTTEELVIDAATCIISMLQHALFHCCNTHYLLKFYDRFLYSAA